MLTEQDSSTGAVRRRYVPGPGTDEPVLWYEGSGTSDKRWLVADERGSVVAVTNASGNAINIKSYDEFGIPNDTTPANAGRFGYTGQAWLPQLGMNYYKARMYSPTLGRFLQTDPIGYGDGLNWYNYVGSDPINARDPSGNGCVANHWSIHVYDGAGRDLGKSTGPDANEWDEVVCTGSGFDFGPAEAPSSSFGDGGTGATGGASQNDDSRPEVTVIAYNGYRHNQIVKDLAEKLRKDGNTVATEFQLCLTGTTVCTRADILFRYRQNRFLYAIDVKTGPSSRFTDNQNIIYPHLITGGLVSTYDPRATNFGLPLGALPPIIGIALYEANPNSQPVRIPWPGSK